ncbi:hypothetical protein BC829DRAFT_444152 [Chytridium lagenaria]|nr:hypothetical protein BC829DRAFT_444152 [Chytridium lagenaria]
MWAVERFGRKPLLVYGGFAMGLAHALVLPSSLDPTTETLVSLGCHLCRLPFPFRLRSTWGPVVWSYQAEIFPLRIRAKGTGVATMTNWTWNAIIAYAFPIVFKALNRQPTTRGKTLEEMDELFGSSSSASQSVELGQEKK